MTKFDPALPIGETDQPTTSTSKKDKKRKPYVKRACLSCHSAHVACDSERPCKRCKKKGIPCVDYIPSKKTKPDNDQGEQEGTEPLEQQVLTPSPKKKKKKDESCVVRMAPPSSNLFDEEMNGEVIGMNTNHTKTPVVISTTKPKTKRKKPSSVKIEEDPESTLNMQVTTPTSVTEPTQFETVNSMPNNTMDMNKMSMYYPYHMMNPLMMQQWFAAQQMAQMQPNQPFQPFFIPPTANQAFGNFTNTTNTTPSSPMAVDNVMSPSTAFPSSNDTLAPFSFYPNYNIPKPLTMLENTDDGLDVINQDPITQYTIGNTEPTIEELDVNNNGIVEDISNEPIIPDSPAARSQTPLYDFSTFDSHPKEEKDDDFFEKYFIPDDEPKDIAHSPVLPTQDLLSDSLTETNREKRPKASTVKTSNNEDEIIDLITKDASLLTSRSKEQVQPKDGEIVSSNDINSDINYVISQSSDSMISKQKIADLIRKIWQTQENQSKEINELKQLVNELKRMIIS